MCGGFDFGKSRRGTICGVILEEGASPLPGTGVFLPASDSRYQQQVHRSPPMHSQQESAQHSPAQRSQELQPPAPPAPPIWVL